MCFRSGFTLIEVMVVLACIAILAALISAVSGEVFAKVHEVKNISNLRTIGVACLKFAADRNGYFWTREEIGHSSYRAADDPLGLPMLLEPYLQNKKVWWNPAGRPSLKEFGNNYAWSRSANVTSVPLAAQATKASTTVLVWDNHTMTLPSVHNVPEMASTGGPRTPSPQSLWRRFPHGKGRGTSANGTLGWLYMDGHVEIK